MSTTAITIDFYQTDTGTRPVHDWLRSLPKPDRKIIGDDIRKIELEWPLSMPTCRYIGRFKGVWELRTRTERLKSIRILFTMEEGKAVLLHSFIKKDDKIPTKMIEIAAQRLSNHRQGSKRRERDRRQSLPR